MKKYIIIAALIPIVALAKDCKISAEKLVMEKVAYSCKNKSSCNFLTIESITSLSGKSKRISKKDYEAFRVFTTGPIYEAVLNKSDCKIIDIYVIGQHDDGAEDDE